MSKPDINTTLWSLLTEAMVSSRRHLEGQLCTLIDATIPDERQVKATKDTIKTLLWAAEKEDEQTLERRLLILCKYPDMKVLPWWLEARLRKEYSEFNVVS